MPELPDITVYVEALRQRLLGGGGASCHSLMIRGPSVLRTVEPTIDACDRRRVLSIDRLGKRIVFELDGDLFIVIHLMIAGRLLWKPGHVRPAGKIDQAALRFDGARPDPHATVILTEASTQKRAGIWMIQGRDALKTLDPAGIDPLKAEFAQFAAAITATNRTLKRAMTDPRTISGIGNAYSDEILHAAKLSPIRLTSKLTEADLRSLHHATRTVLERWTRHLLSEFGIQTMLATQADAKATIGRFPGPGQITAFRPDFAAHGKFGQPCPVCATRIQRIVRADNEMNYCPTCQTNGKVLADRSLSRLLKEDWPSDPADWEP